MMIINNKLGVLFAITLFSSTSIVFGAELKRKPRSAGYSVASAEMEGSWYKGKVAIARRAGFKQRFFSTPQEAHHFVEDSVCGVELPCKERGCLRDLVNKQTRDLNEDALKVARRRKEKWERKAVNSGPKALTEIEQLRTQRLQFEEVGRSVDDEILGVVEGLKAFAIKGYFLSRLVKFLENKEKEGADRKNKRQRMRSSTGGSQGSTQVM
jgi:hypothetical protein